VTSLEEARYLASGGELRTALLAIDQILSAEPEHVEALLLKARLLLDLRDGEAALQWSEATVRLRPDSAEALNGLARCLHVLGRNDEALRAAERARACLEHEPSSLHVGPVYLTLLWCLREERRLGEALEVAEEGLGRCYDSVLAQWASTVEEELAEAEQEGC